MIKIAIVDDHKIIRTGLSELLKEHELIQVSEVFEDGEDLIAAYDNGFRADVILLDIQMKKLNGIETLRILKEKYPLYANAIILTTFYEPIVLEQALELGAMGTLNKDCEIEEIEKAIQTAFYGKQYQNELEGSNVNEKIEAFTNRQLSVISYIIKGYNNHQIAEELGLSLGTIKNYNSIIYQKLGVKQRAEALVRFRELGLC